MLRYAIIFLVIAIIAGIFGFGGIAGTSAWIAKILFVVFLILFGVKPLIFSFMLLSALQGADSYTRKITGAWY